MEILEISPERLADYARISIGFWVEGELAVEPIAGGLGGMKFIERPVAPAYTKDYDVLGPEEGPLFWPQKFDVSQWGFFLAQEDGQVLAGATVAWNTPGIHMLEGRSDLAVLWDIRVQPQARGRGLGRALLGRVEAWARARNCRQLKDRNPE